ncbi:MAG: short chain isoprenyl diphosphate synthase IdsA [Candidatus Sumerlaeia bacterium]
MNTQQFLQAVERESDRLDAVLAEFLHPRGPAIPNLDEALLYQLGLDSSDRTIRGKRLRPALCLLTCRALGGDDRRAMPFALAIELMHNFCLIHDDIEDGDRMRRHRPSLWVRYGLAHGVNAGDYMFCKVFEALVFPPGGDVRYGDQPPLPPSLRLKFLRLMSDTLDHTHRGQALDINARSRDDFTESDYFTLATEKTGYYLAAPMVGGAMAAGARSALLRRLLRFGLLMGPVFQIIDDAIDLTEGKGRGEKGSDIREGKRSFLVALAAGRAAPRDKKRLFRILNKTRGRTTPADVEWVCALFERLDVIGDALRTADEFKERALRELEGAPQALRDMLSAFAAVMVTRKR